MQSKDNFVDKVFPKNTPYPVEKTRLYVTHADGQTKVVLIPVQKVDTEWKRITRVEIDGFAPADAGQATIEVTYTINFDGQFSIQAKDVNRQEQIVSSTPEESKQ